MYVSNAPILPAAAAANAVRAAIMRRAHALAILNAHQKNTYGERLGHFLAFAWREHNKFKADAAAKAQWRATVEGIIAFHRGEGYRIWLSNVPDRPRYLNNCKLKRVIAYNANTNKKEFVTLKHEIEYEGDSSLNVNLVAKLQKNVVYGRVNAYDQFDYVMLNGAGKLTRVRFDDVAHLVPAQAPAPATTFRLNPRTGAKVYPDSYNDDFRDEAFEGTPYHKDDEPLWETESDDLYVEHYD